MFKCGFCGNTSQPREPQTLIVTEVRSKEYLLGYEDEEKRFPITSRGEEVVKEVAACPSCASLRKVDSIITEVEHLSGIQHSTSDASEEALVPVLS